MSEQQPAKQPLPGISHIIAVASGKGGVGKSTVAANLALALKAAGKLVGVLDADIYGPSQPHLFGVSEPGYLKPPVDNKFQPVEVQGLKLMSMGYLVEPGTPMIWRGPMVTQALHQLLYQTEWGELDYLVMDLPPGTGDVQLTLAQKIPVSGAVIVTTPQELSLIDARKGLRMFEKVSVPILGIIENMNGFICPHCDTASDVFGRGAGAVLSEESGVTLLGSLPLDPRIQMHSDEGEPIVVSEPDSDIARRYNEVAAGVIAAIASAGPTQGPSIEVVD